MATRGRPPRKRAKGAGNEVTVKSHARGPRDPTKKGPGQKVVSYKRGKAKKHRKKVSKGQSQG